MIAAYITALPMHLHVVGDPSPAGAVPFRKLATSRGQQRHRDVTEFVVFPVAGFKFVHFCTRHRGFLQDSKYSSMSTIRFSCSTWFQAQNKCDADVTRLRLLPGDLDEIRPKRCFFPVTQPCAVWGRRRPFRCGRSRRSCAAHNQMPSKAKYAAA